MTQDDFLKKLIRCTEERYISYKKLLEGLYKDKEVYEPGNWRIEHKIWFNEYLREQKNHEEGLLKGLRLEIEHHRSGMNPPYMYVTYKRK